MKCRGLLLLTFLLTHTMCLRAMDPPEEFRSQPQYSSVRKAGLPLHASSSAPLKDIWILSIDGGGIRGIIPAQILYDLEQKLRLLIEKRIQQKITEKLGRPLDVPLPDRIRIANAFDFIAGTSTGGIISLGLTIPDPNDVDLPLYTTTTLVDLYKDGEKVFPSQNRKNFFGALFSQKFDAIGLETVKPPKVGPLLASSFR